MPTLNDYKPCAYCYDTIVVQSDEGELISALGASGEVAATAEYNSVPTKRVCLRCQKPFCPKHASSVDPENHCSDCLPEGAILESEIIEPLKDDEGVTHAGRHIIPNGPIYRTLPKAIADMGDLELFEFIESMKRQIQAAESAQDYRKIALSTASLESAGRSDAKRRALQGVRVSVAGKRIIAAANKSKTGKADPAGVVDALSVATGGLSGQKLKDFIAFVAAQRAKKAATVVPSTAPPPSSVSVAPVNTSTAKAVAATTSVVGGQEAAKVPLSGTNNGVKASPPPVEAKPSVREAEIEALLGDKP